MICQFDCQVSESSKCCVRCLISVCMCVCVCVCVSVCLSKYGPKTCGFPLAALQNRVISKTNTHTHTHTHTHLRTAANMENIQERSWRRFEQETCFRDQTNEVSYSETLPKTNSQWSTLGPVRPSCLELQPKSSKKYTLCIKEIAT